MDGLSYWLNNEGKEEKKFLSYNPSLDLFRSSRWKHLVLLPGEMLFLPKHWWHDVTSTAGSVALSINLTEKRTTSPTKILTLKTKRKEKDDDVDEISKTSNCKSSSKKRSKKSSSSSSSTSSSKGRPFTTESSRLRKEKQQRRKEVLKQQRSENLLSSSISTDGIRSSTRKTKKQRGFTCSKCNHEAGSLLYLAGNYVDEQEVSGKNDKLELFCFNCRTPGAKQISESDFGRTIEFDKILVKK